MISALQSDKLQDLLATSSPNIAMFWVVGFFLPELFIAKTAPTKQKEGTRLFQFRNSLLMCKHLYIFIYTYL